MVLCFSWLRLLGRVSHDYSALTMDFIWQGQKVTLKGETEQLPTFVSLHQLLQALLHNKDIQGLFSR